MQILWRQRDSLYAQSKLQIHYWEIRHCQTRISLPYLLSKNAHHKNGLKGGTSLLRLYLFLKRLPAVKHGYDVSQGELHDSAINASTSIEINGHCSIPQALPRHFLLVQLQVTHKKSNEFRQVKKESPATQPAGTGQFKWISCWFAGNGGLACAGKRRRLYLHQQKNKRLAPKPATVSTFDLF